MVDWSSLPSDLLHKISKCFLETDDLDYYMDFRAVCGSWRRATAVDPKTDGTDPRFMPSKWIMLEHSIFVDASVTFVNVSTGRFLRKTFPMLRKYFFIGATGGGLLVLGEEEPPYQTRVLNPFTGAIAHFKAPIPAEEVTVAVMASPMMVFISGVHNDFVRWADQNSESFQEEFMVSHPDYIMNMSTSFTGGGVHFTNRGSIVSTINIVATDEEGNQGRRRRSASTITMATTIPAPTLVEDYDRYYLVESEGDLMLVCGRWVGMGQMVYKVDTVNKVLVPVSDIGNRALFVSCVRCFSVDADKFHTVEAGCIYYVDHAMIVAGEYESGQYITMVRITDRWVEPILDLRLQSRTGCFHPYTLVQVFADYCRTVEYSELELVLYGDDDDYYSDGNELDGSAE